MRLTEVCIFGVALWTRVAAICWKRKVRISYEDSFKEESRIFSQGKSGIGISCRSNRNSDASFVAGVEPSYFATNLKG